MAIGSCNRLSVIIAETRLVSDQVDLLLSDILITLPTFCRLKSLIAARTLGVEVSVIVDLISVFVTSRVRRTPRFECGGMLRVL